MAQGWGWGSVHSTPFVTFMLCPTGIKGTLMHRQSDTYMCVHEHTCAHTCVSAQGEQSVTGQPCWRQEGQAFWVCGAQGCGVVGLGVSDHRSLSPSEGRAALEADERPQSGPPSHFPQRFRGPCLPFP